jgi:probable rRNA maturation factor
MSSATGESDAGVQIQVTDLQEDLPVDPGQLAAQLTAVAGELGLRGLLSVVLVEDERMTALNREFLGVDGTTDVIAFPLGDDLPPGPEPAPTGEVVISTRTACRGAAARGVEPRVELLLYAVHGLLHLAGYDDQDPAAREQMVAEERRLLARLGHTRPDDTPG